LIVPFILCFVTQTFFFLQECAEMIQAKKAKSLGLYFSDIWNIIDIC